MRIRSLLLGAVLLLFLALVASGKAQALTINYPDFSSVAGLTLNGSASQVGNALRLTPAASNNGGSTFYSTPIALGPAQTFSTNFSFEISSGGGAGGGADGLTFVLQTQGPNALGNAGGYLGCAGISPSLAVEFDTYTNSWDNGNGNHVAIDINGDVAHGAALAPISPSLRNGSPWYAWIDYNGTTLEVRLSQSPLRPAAVTFSEALSLSFIGSSAFAGFTAATASGFENHDILSWQFQNVNPIPLPPTVLLLGSGLLGLGGWRRFRKG
jgi:hypothetical protein